jgi:hypothetical protein
MMPHFLLFSREYALSIASGTVVDMQDKARVNRARRAAARQGYTVRKSRTRDPLAVDYGWHVMRGRREVTRFRELHALERWLAGEGRI